jgi:hypothetical protein
MKWVLVDTFDNIVHTVDLNKRYNLNEARKYFINLKRIDEMEFNKLWKVYPIREWDNIQHANRRPPSSDSNRAWWKDEDTYLDIDK